MEEKKAKISNSFRAFSGSKFLNRSFFSASVKASIFTSVKLKSKGFIQHHFKKNQPFNANTGGAGFTLVEILIVIAIVGILVGAFITILNPANQLKTSRDSRRKSDLKQIQAGLELYRADRSAYPVPASNSVANCSGRLVDSCGSTTVVYLQSVPRDPRTGNHYYYCTSSCGVGTGYRVYSCLENSSDAESLGAPPGFISCPANSGYFFVQNP